MTPVQPAVAARTQSPCTRRRHISAAMLQLVLLALLVPRCAAGSPYDPHTPDSDPFFEGWYVRLVDTATPGRPSVAFGLGHLPNQHPENPAAVCFLLFEPQGAAASAPPPRTAVPRTLLLQPARAAHGAAAAWQHRTRLSSGSSSARSSSSPRLATRFFSSLDVHPSKQQAGCFNCPAFVAAASSEAGSCRLEVTGSLVSIAAFFPGEVLEFTATANPDSASILPWGPFPGSSPEGWLPPGLLRSHWFVYSMASPLDYSLTWTPQQGVADSALQLRQPITLSGSALGHLEKNWGEAFPEQWVWAQGINDSPASGGQASFVLAGGSLPIKRGFPALPAFAFSYHSAALNLTVDAFAPAVATTFDHCGCCGALSVRLTGWTHVVVVQVEAPPESFTALPCPTETGFRAAADESFVATAHVRVYGFSSAAASSGQPSADAAAVDDGAGGRLLLLGSGVFEGAALEFGGSFRCRAERAESA